MSGPPRLLVSVTEIRRHPGTRIDVHRTLEAESLAVGDASVPDGAEVELEGELESIHEGVVLTGSVEVPWVGACRRCLVDVAGVATVAVREVYETHPVEGDTWPIESDQVDVGPLLRDTALLALPLAPLCGPDCQGPAPEEFPTAVEGSDTASSGHQAEAAMDPRWAALDDLEL